MRRFLLRHIEVCRFGRRERELSRGFAAIFTVANAMLLRVPAA